MAIKQISNSVLREAIHNADLPIPVQRELWLVGIRGVHPVSFTEVETNANPPNRYNDTIVVAGSNFQMFPATTDPGGAWQKGDNPRGIAYLVAPQLCSYKRGLHKRKAALVQAAAVKVRRDRDRDGRPENNEPIDVGYFGINIHAGGKSPAVGSWSKGCQVIPGGWNGPLWGRFMDMLKLSRQDRFRYYLIRAEHLP